METVKKNSCDRARVKKKFQTSLPEHGGKMKNFYIYEAWCAGLPRYRPPSRFKKPISRLRRGEVSLERDCKHCRLQDTSSRKPLKTDLTGKTTRPPLTEFK